jgi:aminopeptidase N
MPPGRPDVRRWLSLLFMAAASSAPAATVPLEPGVSLALATQRAAVLDDVRYDLTLRIPENRRDPIDGKLQASFHYRPDGQDLQLDFRPDQPGQLRALNVNGVAVAPRLASEHLVLPAERLRAGHNSIEIDFRAGDSSLNRNEEFLYTLFVPDRARTAFPLFDQPDIKASIALTLDTPAGWTALSNAPLVETSATGDSRRWRFAPTDPISSYLFSFVAGRFERITREVDGRAMTLLHRETDAAKVSRNVDAIFALHGSALAWMEDYTGIPLPYPKLDFALIPDFQYGGMEHTGAIQYRAAHLFLEDAPTEAQQLGRASLIAHEVAHMWFGNLVTMRWFNDVWTKEVFANFMAAKIVNPGFPEIDHDLNFLVRHYPGAYAVDRSRGANPIRQRLDNLNLAGQMYGPIIYLKAPIMMRQLELLLGEARLRRGLQTYLQRFAHGNATWPELIGILDKLSDDNVHHWSEVWVNTPGRPRFALETGDSGLTLRQIDPADAGRLWPQRFAMQAPPGAPVSLTVTEPEISLPATGGPLLLNADARGYGLFPADPALLDDWDTLTELQRGALLVNLYDNVLEGNLAPAHYLDSLLQVIASETSSLLLELALGQLAIIHRNFLPEPVRAATRPRIEDVLWSAQTRGGKRLRRQLYESYSELAASEQALERLEALWMGQLQLPGLDLSERDRIRLTELLALRQPERAPALLKRQLDAIESPDNRRRLQFIAPSLSADHRQRDAFFASLARAENREIEAWVLDALANLHHPSRRTQSLAYLPAALEWLEEIQVTGDIFFPARWLNASFSTHNTRAAVDVAEDYLSSRPDLNPQLRMKVLQAIDLTERAAGLLGSGD